MHTPRVLRILFVLVLICNCTWGIKNINIYQKYFFEDVCTDNENVTLELSDRGMFSVAKIGAFRYYDISTGVKNCTIIIKPPYGYSVYLQIESFSFGRRSFGKNEDCDSYIQILGNFRNGTVSDKLCGALTRDSLPSFNSYGNMSILYHHGSNVFISSSGFSFIATAYKTSHCVGKNNFQCENGHCIWDGLICDSVDNCGDSSDELIPFGASQCIDIEPFTIKPINFDWEIAYPTSEIVTFRSSHNISLGAAIAASLFVIMGAFIRFYCYYQCSQARRRQVLSAVTIISARSVLRQPPLNSTAPPPYETLVNDVEGQPENPPEYTAVSVPPSTTEAAAGGGNTQNSVDTAPLAPAGKNVNVSCGPPPPYEP